MLAAIALFGVLAIYYYMAIFFWKALLMITPTGWLVIALLLLCALSSICSSN
jgi:hypothetical protein